MFVDVKTRLDSENKSLDWKEKYLTKALVVENVILLSIPNYGWKAQMLAEEMRANHINQVSYNEVNLWQSSLPFPSSLAFVL